MPGVVPAGGGTCAGAGCGGLGHDARARCYHRPMNTPSSVSFSDLVLMLATMAAVHLGEVGDPVTGETQRTCRRPAR